MVWLVGGKDQRGLVDGSERRMDAAAAYERCVSGLEGFVRKVGFADVIIGLSGGIDSSLVAVMAVDALGSKHVHGVMLPGPYSSDHSLSDARDLVSALGIDAVEISISNTFKAFCQDFEKGCGIKLDGVAAENTQARIRMMDIMAISNMHGWLMLNTGNRSEAAMGYSTLYGDTAGAYAPIGGVYKSDVYKLAIWRNDHAHAAGCVPPIPENVISKPPSAELSPDQNDEDSMGITYDLLDRILFQLCDLGSSIEDVVRAGFDIEDVEKVAKRYAAYEYKRAMEPPFTNIYVAADENG